MKFQIYRTLGYRPNCERLLAVYPALANYNFERDDVGNGYVTITSLNQLMQLIKEIGQDVILFSIGDTNTIEIYDACRE